MGGPDCGIRSLRGGFRPGLRPIGSRRGLGDTRRDFHDKPLVLCPVALVMLRASQGRRWEGRRTKAHLTCVEDEDASSGISGRLDRGKCYRSGHQPQTTSARAGDYVSVDYQDQLCREVR